jgi:hypothetical protein
VSASDNHWLSYRNAVATWVAVPPPGDVFGWLAATPWQAATTEEPGFLRVSGRVAWFEDGPEPVEGVVDDLGALLERLRPEDVEAAAGGFMIHTPPLTVFEGGGRLHLQVHSDIWLPWVPGFLSEDFTTGSWFDNRPLARRHTPDLNALLARLAEGGATVALEEDLTYGVLRDQVGDRGVLLDVPAPGPVH